MLFNAGLNVTAYAQDGDVAYLVQLVRKRADSLSGMFGGVKRGKMASAIQENLVKFLQRTRKNLQAAAKQSAPGSGESRVSYNGQMKMATISETKNSLSALLDRVRHGETVLVTDRGRPVARLEPMASPEEPGRDEGRLARLERAGIIRRAKETRLDQIARVPPPAPVAGGDIVAVLLDERRRGR